MQNKQKIKILFTCVGRRVELIQAFKFAAHNLNIDLCIYGTDLYMNAPALFFCDQKRKVCKISDNDYIPSLISICKNEKIDLLIPTIDTDLLLLAINKEKLEKSGARILLSDAKAIKKCRDKRVTEQFFLECGLLAPITVDSVQNYMEGYPCFVKPRDGSSSIDAYKVNSKEELENIVSRVNDYIVQPYIEGKEYTIDILCDLKGNPVFITPRERVEVRAGEVLKTRVVKDNEMEKESLKIIKAFHPVGPVTVQLIKEVKSGANYYIEINPRFGGGAPLSIKAGADSAKAILQMLLGEKLIYQPFAARENEEYSRFDQSINVKIDMETDRIVKDILEVENLVENVNVVIFDLDDTLYSEKEYVKSGYRKIGEYLIDIANVYERLMRYFKEDKFAIDELIKEEPSLEGRKNELLEIYREQTPNISLYPGVLEMLMRMKNKGIKLGIITDGRVYGQKQKIMALQLGDVFDEIIITDELAGKTDPKIFRKPNFISFEIMQQRFQVPFDQMVYIGDNIQKDFIAPSKLGMSTVYFKNQDGLY